MSRVLSQGIELLEKTGTLVQVGVHNTEEMASYNPFLMYEREQTFVGSNSCAMQFEPAAEFIEDIRPQAAILISDDFDVWDFEVELRASVFGEPIHVPEERELSVLGAAMLAARAAGGSTEFKTPITVIEPVECGAAPAPMPSRGSQPTWCDRIYGRSSR